MEYSSVKRMVHIELFYEGTEPELLFVSQAFKKTDKVFFNIHEAFAMVEPEYSESWK